MNSMISAEYQRVPVEVGGSKLLWNIGDRLPVNTASYPDDDILH